MMSSTVPKPTTCIERLKLQAEAVLPKYAPYLTDRALCYYYFNNADKVLKDVLASIQSDPNFFIKEEH